jgi:hypothetical protein
MGHKVGSLVVVDFVVSSLKLSSCPQQWYRRRKPDASCYVGDKFKDPVATEEDCPCTDEDYEW